MLALSQVVKRRPAQAAASHAGTATVATGPSTPPSLPDAAPEPAQDHLYDVVITGGRVIDPETGFDQVVDVGIDGPTIVAITDKKLNARMTIDAKDRVVAPGFIDLISYDPNPYGIWFKVADGVTTNLGMHGMLMTAEQFFGTYAQQGSPCHYGGAYDNYFMRGVGRFNIGSGEDAVRPPTRPVGRRHRGPAPPGLDRRRRSPRSTALASPTTRSIGRPRWRRSTDCRASSTGATPPTCRPTTTRRRCRRSSTSPATPAHPCTSCTSRRPAARSRCRRRSTRSSRRATAGLDVTACLYPYNFWATYIQSPRFRRRMAAAVPHRLPGPGHPRAPASGSPRHGSTSCAAREENKLVAAYAIPDQDVVTGLQSPMTMIGSDAILTPGDNNHPRGAGCFTRVARVTTSATSRRLSLVDALAKMTILPAKRLEAKAPGPPEEGTAAAGRRRRHHDLRPGEGGRPRHRRGPVPTGGRGRLRARPRHDGPVSGRPRQVQTPRPTDQVGPLTRDPAFVRFYRPKRRKNRTNERDVNQKRGQNWRSSSANSAAGVPADSSASRRPWTSDT